MNSRELISRLRAGDGQAAAELFYRYADRLIALVQARIGTRLGRRIDGDDVVQSAFRSFFVGAADGEYELHRSEDLWRLLASITMHKLQAQIERQTAARRAIEREDAGALSKFEDQSAGGGTPEEVVATIEAWTLATDQLSPLHQTALAAHLRGAAIEEIAESLGKSARTIRRALAEARQAMESELLGETFIGPGGDAEPLGVLGARQQLAYADFDLKRLLGAGGMGKVYEAIERSTGRRFALKALLKARQSDSRAVEKFLDEGRILAELDHPGIVRLRGVGRFPGGGFFLVTEFVDGADLQTRLAAGPLKVEEAVRIAAATADAMAYAHSQGIVHGDLKPGNVLVARDGRVIVTDFGLAQFVADDSPRRRRIVGGTDGYMAPEVRRGGAVPTPAADIYGVGALLWALVTGRPPGGSFVDGGSCAAVERICARCLDAAPERRFSSASELVGALDEFSS